jgi:DHA2 family metal-tetracycline-proton antiporter-like MFS transporter
VLLSLLTLLFVGSNITVNTTLPLPLAEIGGLSASRTGLALLPAALATILAARLSGWAVDTFGPVAPIRAGVAAVVVSLVLLSAFGVDGPLWAASSLAALASVGAVLAKVATTKAVSLSVPRHSLASAISINESVWFVGASLGTVLFSATVTARAEADAAVNPLHSGAGAAYSDAYLALAVPLTALLIVTGRLPRRDRQT